MPVPSSHAPAPALRWTVMAIVALASVVAGCGDGGGSGSEACGPALREALDPQYLVHVLADEGLEYRSDPPTSGPHQPTPPVGGVEDEPLTRPIQVGVLERGDVLLQHRPDLPDADRLALEALAGDRVTVAPNPDLDDAVVATAWVFKQTCSTVDVAELEQFVADRVGHGPDG